MANEQLELSLDENKGFGKALIPSPEVFNIPMTIDQALTMKGGLNMYVDSICKSLTAPPAVYNFGQLQTLPDPNAEGIIAWPGLPPETLRKMAATLLAPKIVAQCRVNDVLGYSQLTRHPWKKGWAIEMMDTQASLTPAIKRTIREAELFIENCNSEFQNTNVRKRDENRYFSFPMFLALITRDSFTYDGIAIYTDMDIKDRIKGFTPLPAGNIRLAGIGGYLADKNKFAVLVDEGGTIYRSFTRDELTWAVRNPRTDATVGQYGLSELDAAAKLVDAFENAFELNMDIFNKSGIPNGMLKLKGLGWTNRELDLITRTWANLKKGVTKFWSLPAMVLPPDTDIEFLDLSTATAHEGLFQGFINMLMGTYCAICNFPIRRLGFRISGTTPEPTPEGAARSQTPAQLFDEEDPGLVTYLQLLEDIINQYILWSRYPHLRFVFRGKTPREDAREFEIRNLARTFGERRAETDLPPLETLITNTKNKEDLELLVEVVNMTPTDPGLAGVYQTAASVFLKAKFGDGGKDMKMPGAPFPAQKDPAQSEAHGDTGGVRRKSFELNEDQGLNEDELVPIWS